MMELKSVWWMTGLLLLAIGFQNCSPVAVSDLTVDKSASLGTPDPEGTPHTETAETLKTIQPALAVRGITCVLCHASINANVITDFGLGTSDFLGSNKHFYNDTSWFNNLAGAWQSSHINGTVFVPNVQVTRQVQNVLGSAYTNQPLLKIVDFMKIPYTTTYRDYLTTQEAQSEMSFNVVPAAGNDKVVEKSQISIRAPAESEIRELAPQLWAVAETAGAARVGSDFPLQLFKQGTGNASYLQNDENTVLECSKADIVVRGTLLLRRLKVNAAGGCRLYVTGTVFIEEGITYVGSGALQNLQISSSSAVMMGLNLATLNNRLIDDNRGLKLVSRDYASLAAQIVQETKNIGNLKDAEKDYSVRASIDYTALLLNAPIVHSRYLGHVQGTIISEAILFALGHFEFRFDPVFTQVNVLPLLKAPVLSVK
jgi:hypothetical protein